MGKKKNEAPKRVILSDQETEDLKERIKNKSITDKDAETLLNLIAFCIWVQERLARAKLTIKRLRNWFGFSSESQNKSKKKKSEAGDSESEQADEDDDASKDKAPVDEEALSSDNNGGGQPPENKALSMPKWDPKQNHGRLSASDYTGCPITVMPFDDEILCSGKCPDCAACETDAKIYPEPPKVMVFLKSQPLIMGDRYQLQRARCSICKTYFTASLPEEMAEETKYKASCKTTLAIMHYYLGLPFYRIEMVQALQGIPLPDATQYDLIQSMYMSVIAPIAQTLKKYAANGHSLYFDDTTQRILEQIQWNKQAANKTEKSAIHATALLSEYDGHRIYLFDTNTLTAGKQLSALMQNRIIDANFKTMSDASASNFPLLDEDLMARWTISLCLSHARRRFIELLGETDEDIQFVVDLIAKVYQHERHCKENNLNEQERLIYHQQHSGPLLSALKTWLNNLMLYKQVEPHSQFGEAITYLLKRWQWFTQFLRIPGVALDNNICEQAIKVVIRYRKNSLFYGTFYSASVGDAMMSVLHTAAYAKINIFDYLNTLQVNEAAVQAAPESWLPWNYQASMAAVANG